MILFHFNALRASLKGNVSLFVLLTPTMLTLAILINITLSFQFNSLNSRGREIILIIQSLAPGWAEPL